MGDSITAEGLAQRALDVNVLDDRQLQSVFGEFGSRNVPIEEFQQALLRRGLLTNYQLNRLLAEVGYRDGFFYGDYKVLYAVGAGTFARVFRAVRKGEDKVYAVKVLRRKFSNDRESPENHRTIESFRREGEFGRALNHPNIVPIHEVYSKGLTHYIVMDFVEGHNLREFFKVRKRFEPLEATRILIDVASGLSYANQQGVTHRDLKMSNVLLSSEGQSQLVDFGLAALDGSSGDEALSKTRNPRTIDYAGLERATGVHKGDTRSDIFFAGCIYYQLLSGKLPMSESRDRLQRLAKARYQEIAPIRTVAPETPLALAMIVNKSIEFDPERRYQKPGEMLLDLKLAAKRIETAAADEEETSPEAPNGEGEETDSKTRTLMVVESDVKMQDVFRQLFKKRGYRVLVTGDPNRAMHRLQEDPTAADLAIFSSGTIGEPAVAAFNEFASEMATKDLPAVLLLGQRQSELAPAAASSDRRAVARMPLKARQLCDLVRRLLAAS